MSTPETRSPAPTDAASPAAPKRMDDIVALCRRRGFIFQSSEIYGGINGFWDYGPLGALLKKNLKDAWWQDVVQQELPGPDNRPIEMVGLDTTIIMNPETWIASGHVGGFNDLMVQDDETNQRFRADHLWGLFLIKGEDKESWSDRVDQLLDRIQDQSLPIPHVPNLTCIATTEGDAVPQIFAILKKIKQKFTVIEEGGKYGTVIHIQGITGGEGFGIVRPVPMWMLEGDRSRHVVSPLSHMSATLMKEPSDQPVSKLREPRQFNLMFDTYVGAVHDEDSKAYLRPETAQGIFVNFWNVVDTSRVRVPFGIAQIGKAFRNEVTPRNFTFRSREFEQMEIEFFIHPAEAEQWYTFWRDTRYAWWQSIGLAGDNLILREHDKDELAHYAKEGAGTSDIEYRFPFTAPGFGELEGVSHRADYDLKAHANHTGKGDKMRYFDQEKNERYFPHVIEPSAGADRGALALLCEAYTPDDSRPSKVFMKFNPRMAPIKAAVFPLVNKDGMPEVAEKLYRQLRRRWMIQFDAKQSIGKRYARMDEAGTPYCFTIDGDTLSDGTVTVRERDTQSQERIAIDQVERYLADRIDLR